MSLEKGWVSRMFQQISQAWHHLFLVERASISLSLFRIAIALTTGFHVLPSFCHLADNYYPLALKETNASFFPLWFLDWIALSPVYVINLMVGVFILSWGCFLLGYRSQLSAIVMMGACYYFYALNSLHIGTLSWDILLVTLVLMAVTNYHGDYFSLDALRQRQFNAYQTKRPFFIQRLLQLQIASIFFYTALYKITQGGNWLTDNPIYYLMNYPPYGVVKNFMLKEWLAAHPSVCYVIGVMVIVAELLLPFLLMIRSTRVMGITLGCLFHLILILTLDVPAIFFFLFPAQMLLFINPDEIIQWINKRREINAQSPRFLVVYDGQCGFCQHALGSLKIMDLFNRVDGIDFHQHQDRLKVYQISLKQLNSQMHVITPAGKVYGGFDAFRRLCWVMPMLWPWLLFLYLPFMAMIGRQVYRLIANNRFIFHRSRTCDNNQCFR